MIEVEVHDYFIIICEDEFMLYWPQSPDPTGWIVEHIEESSRPTSERLPANWVVV